MTRMTLHAIGYNASRGAFEARVDIHRAGTTFRYPCSVEGPVTLEPETVRQSLLHQAERMSDTGASLRSVL